MNERRCEVCELRFNPGSGNAKYCSDPCRYQASSRRRKPCQRCGGAKPPGRATFFCSDKCQLDAKEDAAARALERWASDPEKERRRQSAAALRAKRTPEQRAADREKQRVYRLKKNFGIDGDDYASLLTNQGGRCAICTGRPRSKRLAVDHDHQTGEVRGLLCKRCNHDLLGSAKDTVEILLRAVAYLENPPARAVLARPASPAQSGTVGGVAR